MKEILIIIGLLLAAFIFVVVYFAVNFYPYMLGTLFRNLKSEYARVSKGEVTYSYFVSHFYANYLLISEKDSKDLISFKTEIADMLKFENFIRYVFSDPNVTLNLLRYKWSQYDARELDISRPEPQPEQQSEQSLEPQSEQQDKVYDIFKIKGALDLFNKLVDEDILKKGSYQISVRYSDSINYFQTFLADAIRTELGISRAKRWKYFKELWGDKNFANIYSVAIEKLKESVKSEVDKPKSTSVRQVEGALNEVRKFFPKYTPEDIKY